MESGGNTPDVPMERWNQHPSYGHVSADPTIRGKEWGGGGNERGTSKWDPVAWVVVIRHPYQNKTVRVRWMGSEADSNNQEQTCNHSQREHTMKDAKRTSRKNRNIQPINESTRRTGGAMQPRPPATVRPNQEGIGMEKRQRRVSGDMTTGT